MIITITTINPGTMKFPDSRSGLYQTRTSGADAARNVSRGGLYGGLHALRVQRHQAFGVALRDRRRIGIAAVDQDLHLGRLLLPDLLREVLRNHDAQQASAHVDGLFDRFIAVHFLDDLKIARALEIFHQIAALRRLILS